MRFTCLAALIGVYPSKNSNCHFADTSGQLSGIENPLPRDTLSISAAGLTRAVVNLQVLKNHSRQAWGAVEKDGGHSSRTTPSFFFS